jgi:hypothetical protein
MDLKTQFHCNEYISDEDTGPGESSISVNIYIEAQGAMPTEKIRIKTILDRFYKEIRAELKNNG